MYFKDKEDTNIDAEFNDGNIITKLLNILTKYKFIFIISIVLLLIIILIITLSNKKVTNYLVLDGDEQITLYQNGDYIEPGYAAYNSKNENLNSEVEILTTLDTNKIGEYEITYKLGDIIQTRKVIVIEKPKEYTYIWLKEGRNIFIKLGEKYEEPGYKVYNSTGEDLTNKVKVTGNVDTSKKGSYQIVYSVVNASNVTITETRIITVMDSVIGLSLESDEYTNQNVTINIKVIDNYFDYLILPNGNKITTSTYSYTVNENGTYKFTTTNKKGITKEESIEVKNIDKTEPTGSCSGKYGNGKSIITVNAKDTSGIRKYTIDGKSYTNNEIILYNERSSINVTVYDKAGNTKSISCNLAKENIESKPSSNSSNKPSSSSNQQTTNGLAINKITRDGVIITINSQKKQADISGYYFSYTNKRPDKKSGYISTNKTKLDVVRLPGTTYVWVEDKNGNISDYKTINIPTSSLLMTQGNNYKILKGTKLSDYLSNQGWSIDELNKLIARSVRAAGLYSKVGAATAAISLQTVLAQKYGIKLPYESAGIYRNYGADSKWGNYGHNYITKTDGYYGMDCSAFVTWTYVQTGYSITNLNPPYWAGWKKIALTKENGDIGDILVTHSNTDNRHVKLIIAKTSTEFITAEASGGAYGLIVRTHPYSSTAGYSIQKGENFNTLFGFVEESKYPSGF